MVFEKLNVQEAEVSFFESLGDKNPKKVKLGKWLKSERFLAQLQVMQTEPDKKKKAELKRMLPFITPSGVFKGGHGKNNLVKHSGFISIDMDRKDNLHISNWDDLKDELSKVPEFAYVGRSCSGESWWGLIPIADPEKHGEHFKFIQKAFADLGLVIDSGCGDVNRLRYYAYDLNPFINPDAVRLERFLEPQAVAKAKPSLPGDSSPIERYNASNHFEEILFKHGWLINKVGIDETEYTRPDGAGRSATFHHVKRVFYVFSSNAEPFKANTPYSPFKVLAVLEHGGLPGKKGDPSFDSAYKEIMALEAREDFRAENEFQLWD